VPGEQTPGVDRYEAERAAVIRPGASSDGLSRLMNRILRPSVIASSGSVPGCARIGSPAGRRHR
jgi:hypothetical protein